MAQGIERVLSVDELGNLGWRLNQYQGLANMGMGRTDSEAAFQEFLKRIPSASNLAAIAGSAGQLGSALDVGALPASSASLLPTAALTADLAAAPSMPRVSSLDFLARLVTHHPPFSPAGPVQHHHATNGAVLKMEPPSGPMAMPGLISDAYPHNLHAALSAMPALQASAAAAANPLGPPPPHPVSHHPALAAAAALQLQGQLGHLSRLTAPPLPAARRATSHNTNVNTNSATSHSDGDQDNDKSENRRARRMLSNRESARRSRRRKQEHLSKLEVELNEIAEEKKAAADRAQNLERRCNSIEEENKRLREENERLRDELRFLRNEFSERKGRDSWRRDDDHDRDLPANKRGRANSGEDRIQQRNSGEQQQQRGGGGGGNGGEEWRGRHYEDEQAEGREEQQGQGYNGGRQRH